MKVHFVSLNGEVAEWLNAAASKAVILREWDRGFESPSLLHPPSRKALWRGATAKLKKRRRAGRASTKGWLE